MDIVELTEQNMLSYAGAVNQSRAIPDARTGLKPIHRKIIYEMYADKIRNDGKYKKCAYMVGQIIARFSEHGDAATYDALVRLAQEWIQRYPLLDFHGNAGSQFGDPQAAMRYTEAKLSKLVEEGFLKGLDKNNVDWIPNFTNEEEEPATLPAVFPGLFCLPNQGIGYAVACQFLTMNLTEVAEGLIQYIQGSDFPVLQYDLASGGTIINPEVMEKIYRTGKGTIIVEPAYTIKNNIISITEIPFNIMFDNITDSLVALCEKEELVGISDIRNNSGNGNLEMVIEIAKGYEPEQVLEEIFDKTKLRSSYGINQIALVDNKPKLLTQPQMAEIYVKHNLECIQKEFQFDLDKTNARIEILEGLIAALADIDDIVDIIRKSDSPTEAKNTLMDKYSFTENQAKSILDMKLARLTKLDGVKLNDELQEKQEYAAKCAEIIGSEDSRKQVLIERLTELRDKFGDKRRTKVIQKTITKKASNGTTKQSEPVEDVVITYNPIGYLQRIPISSYRKSNFKSFKCTTEDLVLLFSNKGRFFRISPKDIKSCGVKDKGTAIGAILKLESGEKILNVFSSILNEKHPYLTFVLNNGIIKKVSKYCYFSNNKSLAGLKALKLKDGDYVVSILETNGDILRLETKDKYEIYLELDKIRESQKNSYGIKGIKLSTNDKVVIVETFEKNDKNIITKVQLPNGKGKKIVKK